MDTKVESSKMINDNIVRSIDIKFKELTYQVKVPKQKEKKTILKGISGTFRSGQLTAIMGPSGAGKSSLVNILTGFSKADVSGTIDFGNAHKARKLCCYIMQDDHFYPFFTVQETMVLATNLKISGKSMNVKEKKLLIEQILTALKLENSKHTRCNRLSGGQKKRLSIALELIDNPPVFFLDEPTTGLDSSSSFDTVQVLQTLAKEGRTIVCTIHQPSSNIYNLFDQIYVMTHGYCTYQGKPGRTVDYLKSVGLECPPYHNPADYLLECVNGDYGDYTKILAEAAEKPEWHYTYEHHSGSKSLVADNVPVVKISNASNEGNGKKMLTLSTSKHLYPPSECMRLWLLLGRCHLQIFRDWTLFYLKLVVHILCSILIGILFGDSGTNADKQLSNFSSFIVHTLYLWYTTALPAVLRFPQEISIIKKESFNHWYKLRTMYLASLITSTPVHLVLSSVYIAIAYFMTYQPPEIERFFRMVLAGMMVTICADGLGVLLGTVFNPVNGTFIGSCITCFMLLFSGYPIFLADMSDLSKIISYTSVQRCGIENMMLSVYQNNRADMICPENVLYCHFKNPATFLKTLGMENGDYSLNIILLFVQLIIYRSCAFLTLRRAVRNE